jgi:hypothetical protein
MLKKILIAVAVIIIVFLIIVAMQPGEFRVTRSANITAPQAAVFDQVNDLHKFEKWNPWGKIDPAMKVSYEGAATGVGSVYKWAGNNVCFRCRH